MWWITERSNILVIWTVLVVSLITSNNAAYLRKAKRQIFREQVLPVLGGKIPESAFRADRLTLNKLNKEGYSIPDGILLDHRRAVRHPYPYQEQPDVLRAHQTDDGRFVAIFGKYFNTHPNAVDTTYIIRSPVDLNESRLRYYHDIFELTNKQAYKPIYSEFTLPNSALFERLPKTLSPQRFQRFKNVPQQFSANHQRHLPKQIYYFSNRPRKLSTSNGLNSNIYSHKVNGGASNFYNDFNKSA